MGSLGDSSNEVNPDLSLPPGAGSSDRASSSDWLFGLWPGPPQRFEPLGTEYSNQYQCVGADAWPSWGHNDLSIGASWHEPGGTYGFCAPGGTGIQNQDGKFCAQDVTYRGTDGEICGGDGSWGKTDAEVWYPVAASQ